MKQTKRTAIKVSVFAAILALAILLTSLSAAPVKASANAALPFTLTAPSNVVLTKENIGDSSTTLGMAYSMSNEINAFFVAYSDSGDGASYLASQGITAYDEINIGVQIDWALDDLNDAVSGWHHNAYWDAAPLGTLGQDADGYYHCSEWDIVDSWIYSTQTVNDIWLYRGMNIGGWQGGETWDGVRDQLRPSQYTYTEHDGDLEVRIDWTEHTMYSRARFVITTYNSETTVREYTFSDWSATVAYGKDAATAEPLEPGDVIAPTITGLRLTDEQFNDNPVVAFTLTVSDTLAAQKAQIAAANGTLRVEVEARVKGTTEWKDLHVAGDVTTGELTAALIYLAEPGKVIPAGTEIELRARYLVGQAGQEDFYSGYSKVIGFGSDDIAVSDAPATTGTNESATEKAEKHKCKICGFCPEPLGLCIFIWLIIIVVVVGVAVLVYVIMKKKRDREKEGN